MECEGGRKREGERGREGEKAMKIERDATWTKAVHSLSEAVHACSKCRIRKGDGAEVDKEPPHAQQKGAPNTSPARRPKCISAPRQSSRAEDHDEHVRNRICGSSENM